MLFDTPSISDFINNSYLVRDGKIGCSANLYDYTVDLVPPFKNISINNNLDADSEVTPKRMTKKTTMRFLRVWFSKNGSSKWFSESEMFLRQMFMIDGIWSYEILGNRNKIIHQFYIPKAYTISVKNIIESLKTNVVVTINKEDVLSNYSENENLEFLDYYPSPPYYRNFPILNNDSVLPQINLYQFFKMVPDDSIAGLQVLIQSTNRNDDWHNKISRLILLEKSIGKITSTSNIDGFDSVNLNQTSRSQFNKSDSSNSLFAFRHRVFLFSKNEISVELKNQIEFATNGMHFSGKKYSAISKDEYMKKGISVSDIILNRSTHALGAIVTQSELATFCNFPTNDIVSTNECIERVSEFNVPEDLINNGSMIGISNYAGKKYPICLPAKYRNTHCEILGKIRQGKTTLILTMILEDIKAGHGVGLIYPHDSDMINKLLQLIPKNRVKDVIYINPGIKDYVLAYNHFDKKYQNNPGKLADDFMHNIRCMYPQHWGANMENIFRHLFYALNVLPNSNFFDIPLILNTSNKDGDKLRKRLIEKLKNIDNPEPLRFWLEDLKTNQKDLKPILNKFSGLLLNDDTARAFAYRGKPKIDLRQAMDEKKIVIIYEPVGILGDAGDFDGTLYISDFYYSAMSRSDSDVTTPFYLYIDELHRYTTKDIGDILRECSKFGLCLTLANQQRNQLTSTIQNDMGNIGNFITLKTNYEDGKALERQTGGAVKAEDFVTLDRYNFIAHINGCPVRGNTVVQDIPEKNYMKEILEYNFKNYYVPTQTISYKPENTDRKTVNNRKRIYDTF